MSKSDMSKVVGRMMIKTSILTLILGISLLLSLGCFPPDWEPSPREKIPGRTLLRDEDIFLGVRRGVFAWAEARKLLMSKGYSWWEAENLLYIHLPEEYRWGGKPQRK